MIITEEMLKVKNEKKPTYTCILDGTRLTVEAFGRKCVQDVRELLEEMVAECEAKSKTILSGDTVVIVDPEATYPQYDEFAKRYLCFEQACIWQYGSYPKRGTVGKVFLVADHTTHPDIMGKIAAVKVEDVDDDHEGIYLVDVDGLRRVMEEKEGL